MRVNKRTSLLPASVSLGVLVRWSFMLISRSSLKIPCEKSDFRGGL